MDEKTLVTDSDLDASLLDEQEVEEVLDVVDEVKDDLKEAEKKLEDEDDPAEKTRLGRKVKMLQDKFDELGAKIDQLIAGQSAGVKKAEPDFELDDEDLELPLSKADLKKLLPELMKETESKKVEVRQNYEKVFVAEVLNNLGKNLDDKQHKEVEDIMMKDYNVIVTGDPKTDAKINWLQAERDWVLLGHGGKKQLKLKKDSPPEHDKDEEGEKVKRSDLMSKLDPAAREYADKMGLTAEDIKKALGSK